MTRYNTLIAQFLILAFIGGFPIAAIIYGLFEKYGFQGIFASILAGAISLSIFAFIIYRKWQTEKDVLPQIAHGMESSYATGNLLLGIGNVIAIFCTLAIIVGPLLGMAYVVGGLLVLVGGMLSILCWIGGWSWINSSIVKFR